MCVYSVLTVVWLCSRVTRLSLSGSVCCPRNSFFAAYLTCERKQQRVHHRACWLSCLLGIVRHAAPCCAVLCALGGDAGREQVDV